ncbi:heparin lyase I family protein [Cyanobium sp. NIES-981]|uniref:heparin lyase I family protein n=1 Tax=Cyanobium sp. NIES-981 TaxID=1851505 RepID=UPI0012F92CB0|nr:heparin lyase I family protein [Cyanobium sp. NIES-981]
MPKAATIRVTGEGSILDYNPTFTRVGGGPSARLGSGGNYVEEGSGDLLGKYQGAFIPLRIGEEPGNRFLSFSVAGSGPGAKDRAELTQKGYYKAGKVLQANFRLRIPEGSAISNNSFYLMQLWQLGGKNPFAGIRMRRNESHKVDFITKNVSGNGRRLNRLANFELTPGQWHSFAMRFTFRPGGDSRMTVVADGRQLASWSGKAGTAPVQPIPNRGPTPYYRFKFGIYKRNEPAAGAFSAHFDDMVVGHL